ncbi:hypothetical protein GCM10028895_47660 [Pontibacter rugosus]
MNFYPDEPLDDSEPQAIVWEAVREAFKDMEGVAYYRYPIYSEKGLRFHEADILIVLRLYGIFLIEVKGFSIHNIIGIQGHQWQMRKWYTAEEYPVGQVINQMFALKNWLGSIPSIPQVPYMHHAVALPFIEESEWREKQWHSLPTTQSVKTNAHLTPAALQEWVQEAGAAFQSSVSENTWLMITDTLGRTTPPVAVADKWAPRILQFNGAPPSGDQLRQILGIKPDASKDRTPYMYLVATSFLEAMRGRSTEHMGADFAPELQTKGKTRPQLLFKNALKHMMEPWLKLQGMSLPRVGPMERVYLLNAIDEVAGNNKALRLQLRHDVQKWREVLSQLDEEGIDLQTFDLNEFSKRLALNDRRLVLLIKNLLEAFHRRFELNEIPFEKAARWYIKEGLPAAPIVVMEGFSFFSPLQVCYAERCYELGAQVVFVHSYRAEQEFGFQVLNNTYSPKHSHIFENAKREVIDTLQINDTPLESDLDWLKFYLFANETPSGWSAQRDGSLTVEAFPHRHAEVRSCVNRIVDMLKKDNESQVAVYEARDIRIVSTDPEVYRNLLLEEVEIFRQERLAANLDPILKPEILKVPPRQLLLTPLGRFILTLYNVWDTEDTKSLCMTPEQFITILSSGLLSVPQEGVLPFQMQQSVKRFIACKDQVFARCCTRKSWLDAFDTLSTLPELPRLYRLPSSSLLQSDVGNWRSVLLLVDKLCNRLFNTSDRNISDHIKNLKDGLNTFDHNGMSAVERELLEKIQKVLQELEAKQTAPIATVQFREVLNALVSERKEVVDGWGNQVAVISPEGLDNSCQPIVFFLGADSSRLPRPFHEPWPFYDLDLSNDLEQDRYLFLAAIRATLGKEGKPPHFYISYAQTDENKTLQPSPYFEEVLEFLGLELEEVWVNSNQVLKTGTPIQVQQPDTPNMRRTHDRDFDNDPYILSELLHYKLCPYRYQLERLDPQGYSYTTNFQLRFLAKGVWMNLIFDRWRKEGGEVKGLNNVQNRINALYESTRPLMKQIFNGFSTHDWQEVSRGIKTDLLYWVKSMKYGISFEDMPLRYIPLPNTPGGQRVLVDVPLVYKNGQRTSLFVADALVLHWLAYGKKIQIVLLLVLL